MTGPSFRTDGGESASRSADGTDRPGGKVCPNPDCHIDQRWEGSRGLSCPECATKLVVACSRCDSGAVYEDDEETPYCSDHDPRQVATDGGAVEDDTDGTDEKTLWWGEPLEARRYHVFRGEGAMAQALCGGWMMGYSEDMPHVDPEDDDWRDGKDCKECCRKADVLDGDADE